MTPFLGLRTALYNVPDLARAKTWYSAVLGHGPYFDQPYYVGYNVGGFELGLVPVEAGAPSGPGGSVSYWGVERVETVWEYMIAQGAAPISKPQDVGEGIRVAEVSDPFGNRIGLIENPNFPNQA